MMKNASILSFDMVTSSSVLESSESFSGEQARVLTQAVLRVSDLLCISQQTLSRLLGVSSASVSRLGKKRWIDPYSKEGEFALLLVRLFRSLDAMVGGDSDLAVAWMEAENDHLGGQPSELIESVEGIVHVVEYLDAMRGKL